MEMTVELRKSSADAPTVYRLACEQAKAAEQLASLLESLNSCVQSEAFEADKTPHADGNICGMMHRTSDDLARALRLAYALGQKLGADEMNKPPQNRR